MLAELFPAAELDIVEPSEYLGEATTICDTALEQYRSAGRRQRSKATPSAPAARGAPEHEAG